MSLREQWPQPPPPRTHYLPRGNEIRRDPEEVIDLGKAVCGYHVEPFEVDWQDFTRDSSKVTCEVCVRWLATRAEMALKRRDQPA